MNNNNYPFSKRTNGKIGIYSIASTGGNEYITSPIHPDLMKQLTQEQPSLMTIMNMKVSDEEIAAYEAKENKYEEYSAFIRDSWKCPNGHKIVDFSGDDDGSTTIWCIDGCEYSDITEDYSLEAIIYKRNNLTIPNPHIMLCHEFEVKP